MLREITPHVCPTVHEPQPATIDEVTEDPSEERGQVVVDRVHLDDGHGAVRVQNVEDVERGDRPDVAGTEHEHHARIVIARAAVHPSCLVDCAFRRHTVAHPDLRFVAREEQAVDSRRREYIDNGPSVRARVRLRQRERGLALLDARESGQQARDALQEGPRPREPVFGRPRSPRLDPLVPLRFGHHRLGLREDPRAQCVEQRDLLHERHGHPGIGVRSQVGHRVIE